MCDTLLLQLGITRIFGQPHTDPRPMNHPDLVFAYLDPMSGSLILQAVIAGVLGGIVTMKRAGLGVKDLMSRAWKRIKG
jgi:hypothetical protein